jgi:DNA invertase Pin-like site-specific DNA recombinase
MMTTVGYARVSSTGQDLTVQLEKLTRNFFPEALRSVT